MTLFRQILLACLCVFLLTAVAESVVFDWTTVGNPGNAADPNTGAGAVSYTYRISKFEVTNDEYAEFLNAVAETDTYGLYNTNMDSDNDPSYGVGGIERIGSSGSYF